MELTADNCLWTDRSGNVTTYKVAPTQSRASNFGRVLRRRRAAADMSQEALAEAAGLHRTFVSLLERGLRRPSLEVVLRLAKALETTGADFVREVESRDPR